MRLVCNRAMRISDQGASSRVAGPRGLAGAWPYPALNWLGDYRILREIGHGGMGVVYEVEQGSLGRRVALQVLPLARPKSSRGLRCWS